MYEQLLDPQQWLIVGQVGVAAVLGALIGLERQIARKPAGLRTHMLVAAGSCLIVALMPLLVQRFGAGGANSVVRIDPARLIQTVITGIAVLGAGAIIVHRKGHRVEGMTTAASVMLTCGIGCAIAVKAWVVGSVVAVLVTVVLLCLGRLEDRVLADRDG